jgi:hypothetical protein
MSNQDGPITLKQQYSTDFLIVRRAVFNNFIAFSAPIKEEDLTPEDIYTIISEVGLDYTERNKRGLTEVKRNVNVGEYNEYHWLIEARESSE